MRSWHSSRTTIRIQGIVLFTRDADGVMTAWSVRMMGNNGRPYIYEA